VVHGTCKLCLEENDLQDSHLVAPAFYPAKPRFVNQRILLPTDRQVKDYVFCAGCEDLLNKNGVSPVLALISPNTPNFPLLAQLQASPCIAVRPSVGNTFRTSQRNKDRAVRVLHGQPCLACGSSRLTDVRRINQRAAQHWVVRRALSEVSPGPISLPI